MNLFSTRRFVMTSICRACTEEELAASLSNSELGQMTSCLISWIYEGMYDGESIAMLPRLPGTITTYMGV